MASTPSASALSAVLRCRRSIWTRNPPTKRPPRLGVQPRRDSPAERSASNQASAWEAVPPGERVVVMVGGRLTVSYREGGKVSREKSKLRDPKLWPAPGDARERPCRPAERPAAPQITHTVKYQRYSAHVRETAFVKDASESPAAVLKLSVTSCPGFMENAGQIPSFVSAGWSALKSTRLSRAVLFNVAELCRASSGERTKAPGAAPCRRRNTPPRAATGRKA